MLLRYVVLHRFVPATDEQWAEYAKWKQAQLHLAECHNADVDSDSLDHCEGCPGRPGCPKRPRA